MQTISRLTKPTAQRYDFPYFLGFADEIGTGEGTGWNKNFPLPLGTRFDVWSKALIDACALVGGCV